MKRALFCLRIGLLLATATSSAPQGRAPAEFRFARLQYTQLLDESSVKGWYTDHPTADEHIVSLLNRITNIHATSTLVRPSDKALFQYPFIYVVEPEQMNLSAFDVKQLREYIARGGFLLLDDFHSEEELRVVLQDVAKIVPGSLPYELWPEHEVYHCFYDIPRLVQVLNDGLAECIDCEKWENGPSGRLPKMLAIDNNEGRIAILMAYNNDLGDGLEFANDPNYPVPMTVFAVKFIVNVVVYAMTH